MKDIWRNEIMHTRRLYNDVEALSVIGRVRDFVQPIASIEAKKRISKDLQRMYKLQKTRAGSLVSLVELLQKKPG